MKLKKDYYNAISDEDNDDEDANEDSGDEEDQEDEVNGDDVDSQEDDEGDELEDDEDEPSESAAASELTAPNQSLGVGNKKNILKQPDDKRTIMKKSPVNKLVDEAIKHLNERHGSSTVAIKRFIVSQHPDMDKPRLVLSIKRYIKSCLDNGTMEQIKYSFKFTKLYANEEKEKLQVERKKNKQIAKDKQKGKKKSGKAKKDDKPEKKPKNKTAGGAEVKEKGKTASKTSSSKAAKSDKPSGNVAKVKTTKNTASEKTTIKMVPRNL